MKTKYLIQTQELINNGYVSGWNAQDLAEHLEQKAEVNNFKHKQYGSAAFSGTVLSSNSKIISIDNDNESEED